ncbi:ribonuclease H-like protein [Marasmius fiardii PR-910]|nr:ribonuclease H-like protein [Marasmius fiardii PR-910]
MYSNSEITKRNHAIGIEEIRDLTLHIIADAPPPNWLRVENASLITKVVAILIPGVTPDILGLPPLPTSAMFNPNLPISIPLPPRPEPGKEIQSSGLPFIASTFSHACPTRAPGDSTRMHSVLSTFFNAPISNSEKKKRMADKKMSEIFGNKDPEQYLLTLEQMIENDYPVPSYMADVFQKSRGWIETPKQPKESLLMSSEGEGEGEEKAKRKIYSIDCEMCLTEEGKELTRVCLIDFDSEIVVYDQLVKPSKPVVDYLTRWSGITATALATATTTFSEAQAQILRILSPPVNNPFSTEKPKTSPPSTPILVGHSLESDLKALKICHPLCIDTAIIYHHPRGRPLKPGLAWLTKKWCNREIQTRGEGGHDPEEDARACVELLKKKLIEGPMFGEFKTDYESIFERMSRSTRRAGGGVGSIKCAVVDHGNPTMMHGNKATTSIGCSSDEEVLSNLLEVLPSHHFAFGRFMSLANILGWVTPKATPDGPPPEPVPTPTPDAIATVLSELNTQLKSLHASLPSRTAVVIFTGHSDPRRMVTLNARKHAFETAIRNSKSITTLQPEEQWSTRDSRALEEAVELAKRGLLFLGVKP